MKHKYLWTSLLAGGVLLLDQATKYMVLRYIPRHSAITIIEGFFNLTNVRNPGAAFGFLAGDHGAWRRVFFVVVTLAALLVLVALMRKAQDRLLLAAFALIGGGAVGNLIDRLMFGEVVDFIDWYYKTWHWPTFNIADSAITIGVALLALDMFLKKPKDDLKRIDN